MFDFLNDIGEAIGKTVGTCMGITIAPIADALGCSVEAVKRAIRSGCRSYSEIQQWIKENEWP